MRLIAALVVFMTILNGCDVQKDMPHAKADSCLIRVELSQIEDLEEKYYGYRNICSRAISVGSPRVINLSGSTSVATLMYFIPAEESFKIPRPSLGPGSVVACYQPYRPDFADDGLSYICD